MLSKKEVLIAVIGVLAALAVSVGIVIAIIKITHIPKEPPTSAPTTSAPTTSAPTTGNTNNTDNKNNLFKNNIYPFINRC